MKRLSIVRLGVLVLASSLPDVSGVLVSHPAIEWLEQDLTPPADVPSAIKTGFCADVVVDGGTVIIGARREIRSDPGRAYVYIRENQEWRLQGEFLPEPNFFTPFGFEDDTALVSAFPTGFNGGFVYHFNRSAGAGNRTGTLNSIEQQDFLDIASTSHSGIFLRSSKTLLHHRSAFIPVESRKRSFVQSPNFELKSYETSSIIYPGLCLRCALLVARSLSSASHRCARRH